MEKFDQWFFSKIEISTFIFLSIVLSFAGDGIYLIFVKFVLGSEENLKHWMESYSWMPNMKLLLNNPELLSQMQASFHLILNTLIALVLAFNLMGYIFFFKRKRFAIKYVRNLAFTGLILGFFAIWEAKDHGLLWIALMILLIPLYFVVYRGIKYFLKEQL